MKKLIILFTLTLIVAYSSFEHGFARAEDVCPKLAKINYYEVQDLLIDIILSDPANKELKQKYELHKSQQKAQTEALMKQVLDANDTLTIPLGSSDNKLRDYEAQISVSKLAKTEFSRIVEAEFKDYNIIIDGGAMEVLYAKIAIPDLTPQFKNLLNKKRP